MTNTNTTTTSKPPSSCLITTLHLLLLLQSILTKPAHSIGCPADPAIPGFATLKELFDFSALEFKAVLSGQPIREPPYIYFLCPNTIYYPEQEGYHLFPLLDDTFYLCGLDGKSENECVIEGGSTQAQIAHSFREGYVKKNMGFVGLKFQGSTFVSVRGESSKDEIASFLDCHWTENTGFATIMSLHTPPPTPSPTSSPSTSPSTIITTPTSALAATGKSPTYTEEENGNNDNNENDRGRILLEEEEIISTSMVFTNCTFSNAYKNENDTYPNFYGIVNARGKMVLDGCDIYNNTGRMSVVSENSATRIIRSTIRHNINEEEVVTMTLGRTGIVDSVIRNNKAKHIIYMLNEDFSMTGSKLIENEVGVSSVHAIGGSVDITETSFESTNTEVPDTYAFADVAVFQGANFSVTTSCFSSGNHLIGPVFANSDVTLLENYENFESNNSATCKGVFIENPGASCVTLSNCTGSCETLERNFCGPEPSSSPSAAPSISPSVYPTQSNKPTVVPSSVPSVKEDLINVLNNPESSSSTVLPRMGISVTFFTIINILLTITVGLIV